MLEKDRAGVSLFVLVGGLVIALIAGFGLGRLTQPTKPPVSTAAPQGPGAHVHDPAVAAEAEVGGLAISSGGYTLTPLSHEGGQITFVIKASDGLPVTDYVIVHEKPLHLVVMRRDLTGYQHLHPELHPDGTWSIAANLTSPGVWRVFADFTVNDAAAGAQRAVTLGYDITIPGSYEPASVPPAAPMSTVDGMTVTYEGTPKVGVTQPMLFRVANAAGPVELQPYLGSFGHLVAVRDRDLAYVHVHPEPQLESGAVKFWVSAPSPGTYRMFFDFQTGGTVRTGEFTLVV